jgi:hypothetical protein
MPDHLHGILWLIDPVARYEPRGKDGPAAGSIGAAIAQFKSRVTKAAERAGLLPAEERLWHRGYHDRRLPTGQAVTSARLYVAMNPIHWDRSHRPPGSS